MGEEEVESMRAELTHKRKRLGFEKEALPQIDFLYRFAVRLAGEAAVAEDLTQETMLKAYRSWHRYRPNSSVRGWLATILRNTFFDEYPKRRRQVVSVDADEMESTAFSSDAREADPEAQYFDQIVDDEVLRAIDSLAVVYREALVLSDMVGLSYIQISHITGVPLGTVKSRIFRARQTLQRMLYGYAVQMGYVKPRGTAVLE